MSESVALVNGATGGIGTAICRRLTDDGFKVVAGYSNADKAKRWQAEQKAAGYEIAIVYANVADFESCQRCYQTILASQGPKPALAGTFGQCQCLFETPAHALTACISGATG